MSHYIIMKIGKLNSRLNRFGSKVRSDISSSVGKVNKTIKQGERIAKRAVDETAKVADSKAVKGIQQATGLAGRALLASGVPQVQALGAGLIATQEGIKATRKAIPDKAEKAKKQIGGFSANLQSKAIQGGQALTSGVRKADEYRKNVLERKEPVNAMDELPNYVD